MDQNLNKEEETQKDNNITGFGLIIGAAIGTIFGLMLFENMAIGGGIGAGMGLIIGAVIDLQKNK